MSLNRSWKSEPHKKVVFVSHQVGMTDKRKTGISQRDYPKLKFLGWFAFALQNPCFLFDCSPWQMTATEGQHSNNPSFMKKGQKHVTWNDTAADAACCSAGLYFEVYHVSWIAKNSIRQGEWLHILTRRQDSRWGKSLKDKCL